MRKPEGKFHGYVGGVLLQFHTHGFGTPASTIGGQQPGAGGHGIGAGAPHGGFDAPQQAVSQHGEHDGPQGPQGPQGPHDGPHGAQPPQARAHNAAVSLQRIRLLFTPIVILA
uniref:Uncharacterized protein n=1 Tax=Bactrocera dorsalis TaxID=27457 RepID=A0A034W8M3_BACDO